MLIKNLQIYVAIPALIVLLANLVGLAAGATSDFFNSYLLERIYDIARPWIVPTFVTVLGIFIALTWLPASRENTQSIENHAYAYRKKKPQIDSKETLYRKWRNGARRWVCRILSTLKFLAAFVALAVLVFYGLLALFELSVFKRYNLVFFFLLVFAVLQFSLWPNVLGALTWKKLTAWLTTPTVGTIAVGGFGFIATTDAIRNPLIKLTLNSSYANPDLMVPATLFGILLMVIAKLVERVGRAISTNEESNEPIRWFYWTFGLAFAANVIMFGLLFQGVFLTIHTHYAGVPA